MALEIFRAVVAVLFWVALVAVVLAVATATGSASRARMERFAHRQRLRITVDNGRQVMAYLATTRRWRVGGLVVGLVAGALAAPYTRAYLPVDLGMVFGGWFLGALIAEVRVAHVEHGAIRVASLHPRRPDRYIRRFVWSLVPAAGAVAVLTATATAIAHAMGLISVDRVFAPMWSLLAIAVAVAVRRVQHTVLGRPQPLAAPDVLEADDAIRSRSLHVLSGGGASLVLFLTLNVLVAVGLRTLDAQHTIDLARSLAPVPVALLGWLVATSTWPPPARVQPAVGKV